jgi:NAD(P)-dependent dehydrogenase (short-subunit alcohol dehydrogenase family)
MQDSVRAFAAAINKRPGSLDILVNNAGVGYLKKATTGDGVGVLVQVRASTPACRPASQPACLGRALGM